MFQRLRSGCVAEFFTIMGWKFDDIQYKVSFRFQLVERLTLRDGKLSVWEWMCECLREKLGEKKVSQRLWSSKADESLCCVYNGVDITKRALWAAPVNCIWHFKRELPCARSNRENSRKLILITARKKLFDHRENLCRQWIEKLIFRSTWKLQKYEKWIFNFNETLSEDEFRELNIFLEEVNILFTNIVNELESGDCVSTKINQLVNFSRRCAKISARFKWHAVPIFR